MGSFDTHRRGRSNWLTEGLRGIGLVTALSLAFAATCLAVAVVVAWLT